MAWHCYGADRKYRAKAILKWRGLPTVGNEASRTAMPSDVGLALLHRVSPLYLPAIEISTLQCNFYIARMPQRTKAFPQKAEQAISEVRILAFLSRCPYQLDVCAKSQARLLNRAVKFRDAVSGDFRLGDHGRILEWNVLKQCASAGITQFSCLT